MAYAPPKPPAPGQGPSSWQGAEASVEAQRRALLQAVAQQGQAGQQAYQQQASSGNAARQAAVQGAAQRANAIGAPADLVQQNVAMAGAGTPAGDPTMGAAGVYGQEMGRIQASGDNYMRQVQAAVPIQRSVTQGAVDTRIAELAHEKQMAMMQEAESAREQQRAEERFQWEKADREDKDGDGNPDFIPKVDPVPVDQAASQARFTGKQAGLTGRDKVRYATEISQTKAYADMSTIIQNAIAGGQSWDQAHTAILTYFNTPKDDPDFVGGGHAYPDTLALLEAQYKWLFGAKKGDKRPVYGAPKDEPGHRPGTRPHNQGANTGRRGPAQRELDIIQSAGGGGSRAARYGGVDTGGMHLG